MWIPVRQQVPRWPALRHSAAKQKPSQKRPASERSQATASFFGVASSCVEARENQRPHSTMGSRAGPISAIGPLGRPMAKTNLIVRNLDDAIKAYGGKRKFAEAFDYVGTKEIDRWVEHWNVMGVQSPNFSEKLPRTNLDQ
jgi:hypothetical protein